MRELDTKSVRFFSGARPPWPSIEVVGMDYNQNGIIDSEDLAMLMEAYGSSEGEPKYERRFDNDFNSIIGAVDKGIVESQLGLSIADIRSIVRTGEITHITWPADPPFWPNDFVAPLVAIDRGAIAMFIGGYCPKTQERYNGWTTVSMHPYMPGYFCVCFGLDMATAAYKGLGYGHLLFAWSTNHGYNIFWTGGDWHDLSNWVVLEPQTRQMWRASDITWSMHATSRIHFPISGQGKGMSCVILEVDYSSATVTLGGFGVGVSCGGAEEPIPAIFFTGVP